MAESVPLRLAAGVSLHLDERGSGVLRLTSGAQIPLNAAAARALQLCDGSRDEAQIVAAMVDTSRQADGSASDVLDFLHSALRLGWICAPHAHRHARH